MLQDFKGKTVVITGAASGFGLAMAHRFAREGMNLVLADILEEGLAAAKEELQQSPAEVLTQRTNVADAREVQQLADTAFNQFGAVHLLLNNAGISSVGPVWETKMEDWKQVFDVNFFGIVNGLQAFLSRMMQQSFPSHIVNTASAAGLLSPPGLSIYSATKHAAVALSETLYAELALVQSPVGVSVLCPAWVKTGIAGKKTPEEINRMSPLTKRMAASVIKAIETSTISAEEVAEATFEAVRKGEFYILTHPEVEEDFRKRAAKIKNGGDPDLQAFKK